MTVLVCIDPRKRTLARYIGRKRTHGAQVLEPITRETRSAIEYFRLYPLLNRNYVERGPNGPVDPTPGGAA